MKSQSRHYGLWISIMYENYSFNNQCSPYVSLILIAPSNVQLLTRTAIREIGVRLYPGRDKSKMFGIL